jgi:hypothetical protein
MVQLSLSDYLHVHLLGVWHAGQAVQCRPIQGSCQMSQGSLLLHGHVHRHADKSKSKQHETAVPVLHCVDLHRKPLPANWSYPLATQQQLCYAAVSTQVNVAARVPQSAASSDKCLKRRCAVNPRIACDIRHTAVTANTQHSHSFCRDALQYKISTVAWLPSSTLQHTVIVEQPGVGQLEASQKIERTYAAVRQQIWQPAMDGCMLLHRNEHYSKLLKAWQRADLDG